MPRVQVSMFGAKLTLKGQFYAHFVVTETLLNSGDLF